MRRDALLKSYVSQEEKLVAINLATCANISVSEVMRQLLVHGETPDPQDRETVVTLSRANADLARLGNLLKMGMDEETLDRAGADSLLRQIRSGQNEIRRLVREIQESAKVRKPRRDARAHPINTQRGGGNLNDHTNR